MDYSRKYSVLYRVAEENLTQLAERRAFLWPVLEVLTAYSFLQVWLWKKKKDTHLVGAGKLNWRLEVKKSTR